MDEKQHIIMYTRFANSIFLLIRTDSKNEPTQSNDNITLKKKKKNINGNNKTTMDNGAL